MFDVAYVMRSLLWVAYILYVGCFVPQVVTNHRMGSTKGLSNATIFIYFFGYLIEILYAYLLGLPLALRVMIPVGAGIAGALVVQRIYFENRWWRRWQAMSLYGTLLLIAAFLTGWGMAHPHFVGHVCGWIGTVCWLVYQIPQIYKIHRAKSVEGFNYWFIIIASIGSVIEIAAAVAIPLPPQALFNGCRGLLGSMIFTYQFYKYHKHSWYKWVS